MSELLCITFRFIQPFPLFHGLGNAGLAEWPPSPLRVFQAILNAVGMRLRGRQWDDELRSALLALERGRPMIIAPSASLAEVGYRAYVPHNQADLVAASWHRGNANDSIATHRIEKDFRPMQLAVCDDELPALHYLYSFPSDRCHILCDALRPYVRSVSALGWGIDQVAGNVEVIPTTEALALEGERWELSTSGGSRLRVPRSGTLESLVARHERFENRISNGEFSPVPPLTAMDIVAYRRKSDPAGLPHAVFRLVDENEEPYRHPHARLNHVAAMVRHLAISRMEADPPPWLEDPADWINTTVRGKRDPSRSEPHRQFSYVPLPSIGHQHADGIVRNVMIVAPLGADRELEYLAERLDGESLTRENDGFDDETPASNQPRSIELQRFRPRPGKFIAECYLGTSRIWHTVTPVILDGHNKKSKSDKPEAVARETEKLICKSLARSGIEMPCTFAWQAMPFLKNCLSAHKYDRTGRHVGYHRPSHLRDLTAVHVRLEFEQPVTGPVIIGAGRHCGFGLFSAVLDAEP